MFCISRQHLTKIVFVLTWVYGVFLSRITRKTAQTTTALIIATKAAENRMVSGAKDAISAGQIRVKFFFKAFFRKKEQRSNYTEHHGGCDRQIWNKVDRICGA